MPNPETEKQTEIPAGEQTKLGGPEQVASMKVHNAAEKLRVYWSPEDMRNLEGSVKQITAMLNNRIKRKREILAAIKNGKKPPIDFNPADSTIRQAWNNLDLRAQKWLTMRGYAPAYREFTAAFNDYIDLKRNQIIELDKDITLAQKESKNKQSDKAKEEEIRKKLLAKKAA